MKKCCTCKTKQSKKEFSNNKSKKDGLSSQCISCIKKHRKQPEVKKRAQESHKQWCEINMNNISEYNKQYYKENREERIKYSKKYNNTPKGREINRNSKLKNKYGITLEDYNQMFEVQSGKCKICGTEENGNKRFFVDHDHKSEKVRGLLCHKCNIILGNAGDSVNVLSKAIEYLQGKL